MKVCTGHGNVKEFGKASQQICLDWIENMKVCTGPGNVKKFGKAPEQICLNWIETVKVCTGPRNVKIIGKAICRDKKLASRAASCGNK